MRVSHYVPQTRVSTSAAVKRVMRVSTGITVPIPKRIRRILCSLLNSASLNSFTFSAYRCRFPKLK